MFITDPDINRYIQTLTENLDFDNDILQQMEQFAIEKNFPIVGRQVGVLLYILTKIKKPKMIVEMGSGYGYSGYWFAKALEDDGKVILTDFQKNNIDMAKNYFEKAGILKRAIFRVGDAIDIAKEYENIDILFMDLEKAKYLEAIKSVKDRVRKNGIIIADNVLQRGQVVKESTDKKTNVIKEFNEYMSKSKEFVSQIVPVRDGVLIAVKV